MKFFLSNVHRFKTLCIRPELTFPCAYLSDSLVVKSVVKSVHFLYVCSLFDCERYLITRVSIIRRMVLDRAELLLCFAPILKGSLLGFVLGVECMVYSVLMPNHLQPFHLLFA